MRIGILDIIAPPSRHPGRALYRLLVNKQFAAVTPQAVSVWCRRLGHETFYATYYGVGDPRKRLPRDLDLVFVSCTTRTSPLAYALGKIFRREGSTTVLGGPHAKAFPLDCLRFFDLVVKECDEDLVADVLAGHFDPGSVISSAQPFDDVPLIEERLPEIRASAFVRGKWRAMVTVVPTMTSTGCPYQCDFCVDWATPYRTLSSERIAADLRFVARNLPGAVVAFHDPNYAVKFDEVLSVLEAVPPDERAPYMIQSSLSVLRGDRLRRLKETNCVFVAPGIESWSDYDDKAGVGNKGDSEKVVDVAERLRLVHENVPNIQVNFIFGLDADAGTAPAELAKAFMDRTPFLWSSYNVPVPFGGTPWFHDLLASGRILRAMPFGHYHAPYLAVRPRHYDPVEFYETFIDIVSHSISPAALRQQIQHTSHWSVRVTLAVRAAFVRAGLRQSHEILGLLRSDRPFLAFHEGRSEELPEFYHHAYRRRFGPYADLLSRADRVPVLQQDE